MTFQDLPSRHSNSLYSQIRNILVFLDASLKRLLNDLIHDITKLRLSISVLSSKPGSGMIS